MIVQALREQQANVAADRGDSFVGEVFTVVVETVRAGDEVRPKVVAAEVNQRRADTEGMDVDKLPGKRRVTPHVVANILRKELELTRLEKDRDGARYRLDTGRLDQLRVRFGHTLPATSQTSHRHTGVQSSQENLPYGVENEDCDVGDVCDVPQRGRDDWEDERHETPSERHSNGDDGPDAAAWARN